MVNVLKAFSMTCKSVAFSLLAFIWFTRLRVRGKWLDMLFDFSICDNSNFLLKVCSLTFFTPNSFISIHKNIPGLLGCSFISYLVKCKRIINWYKKFLAFTSFFLTYLTCWTTSSPSFGFSNPPLTIFHRSRYSKWQLHLNSQTIEIILVIQICKFWW